MNLKKNETQLVCIAEFTALPGKADLLLKNLHSLIHLTLQEGACIRYELNQSIDTPEVITFIEKWYDQKTFDAHCAQDYIVNFFNNGHPDHCESFKVSLHKEILSV